MNAQIEQQIAAWQQALEQLQAQRQRLAAQLTDVDTSIQRHIGAIEGARHLAAGLTPPASEEAGADDTNGNTPNNR